MLQYRVMEEVLLDILAALRRLSGADAAADAKALEAAIRRANRGRAADAPRIAKRDLLPAYRAFKEGEPARWEAWRIEPALEERLVRTLKMKPRRTASGVATVTVLTKPWRCAHACLYCPNDVRMPKSYLADEPACQRAERVWFDPYLQVNARLSVLSQMGHAIDKVELIVLGGTWNDYPERYRLWFAAELFRALNEFGCEEADASAAARRARYEQAGIPSDAEGARARAAEAQAAIARGALSYNEAIGALYEHDPAWQQVSAAQTATLEELALRHNANESASCRCVGLVVETRPDDIDCANLALLRRIGCTKVQIGIQSLDPRILAANCRGAGIEETRRAFALLRLFGFKIHAHFMANLLGATPASDKRDYARFVTDAAYLPDEVKLYPCALVAGTGLVTHYENGGWRPYTEDELLDVLVADAAATPPFTRISRMIRDISAHDIMAGNKKVNLRQLVEERACAQGAALRDIRSREIGTESTETGDLSLQEIRYRTSVSDEVFLQWATSEGRIAGFLRLSLPDADALRALGDGAPVPPGEAMIREVHVYGATSRLHRMEAGVQHRGLGRQLVERACALAHDAGRARIRVISAVGTRAYYRALGFEDAGLYQVRDLTDGEGGRA